HRGGLVSARLRVPRRGRVYAVLPWPGRLDRPGDDFLVSRLPPVRVSAFRRAVSGAELRLFRHEGCAEPPAAGDDAADAVLLLIVRGAPGARLDTRSVALVHPTPDPVCHDVADRRAAGTAALAVTA